MSQMCIPNVLKKQGTIKKIKNDNMLLKIIQKMTPFWQARQRNVDKGSIRTVLNITLTTHKHSEIRNGESQLKSKKFKKWLSVQVSQKTKSSLAPRD